MKIRRCPRNGNWVIISPEARYQPFAAHHFKVHNDDAEGVVCGFLIKLHAIPSLNRKFTNIALGKSMKHKQLTTVIAALLSSSTVLAETTPLETTLVTATRTKQTIDETLAPVSVFTREDIERLQAKDIAELLSEAPGVVISQDGSKGSTTSLFIRGTNSDHTLILVNGQRISSATLGDTAVQFLDPEQIERVEIVRGPRSSIYGSEAIGGVIQIFTKNGKNSEATYIRTGAGSNDSWQLAAGTRGKVGSTYYSVDASYFDTNGFDALVDTTSLNRDNDGYENKSASISLGHQFENNSHLEFSFMYSDSAEEHDNLYGDTRPYSDHVIQTAAITYSSSPIEDLWFSTISLGNSIDESNQRDKDDPSSSSDFETSRDSLLWQNDFKIADNHALTLGYEYYDDQVDSTENYTDRVGTPVDSRDNTAFFGVYQTTIRALDIQLGLREDDNEEFGKTTTANTAFGYNINQQHSVIISYGEGFKAPTFNDLYWPIGPYSYGNPDLQPESSESYEIELRGDYGNVGWSANIYRTDIDNLIDWAPDANFAYTPTNIASVRIKGIELNATATVAEWQLRGSINYNEPEDRDTGNTLAKRPEKSAIFAADRHIGKWDIGASWRAYSERFDTVSNTIGTAGYGLVDIRAGYQISNNLKAQLKLNNIFDKDYQTNSRYNQDGFNGFATLNYSL